MEAGKIYKVNHCRKGVFSFRVIEDTEEWVTGEIVGGKIKNLAYWINADNVSGDVLTLRKSFIKIEIIECSTIDRGM